jgi:hypothetical protein
MDALVIGIIVFVAVFVLIMSVWFISLMINKKKANIFRNYIKKNFPDLPQGYPILMAKQKSKTTLLNIAIAINETKKELLLFLADKEKGIIHKAFSFNDLKAVESSDKIIERGVFPKTYSYEKTMMIKFKNGNTYSFILEGLCDKYGEGKGSDIIRDLFATWEEDLKEIIK